MQAMIFAAGLGTRLKPLTDQCPKALVKLASRPLIDHVIDKLRRAGAERIVVNVHHYGRQIAEHLSSLPLKDIDILISDETQRLLDTGGGVRKALSLIDTGKPLLLHNVDILSSSSLSDFIREAQRMYRQGGCDAALMVSRRSSTRCLLFDKEMRLTGWKNIATGEVRPHSDGKEEQTSHVYELAFSGIHMLFPPVYRTLTDFPERFSITDFYIRTCKTNTYRGVLMADDTLIDLGTPQRLAAAEKLLKNS